MAIKRPAPKKLSEAAQSAIAQASAQQTGHAQRVKSYDPAFPVFDVPVNKKLLVYIPNHRVVAPDGSVSMRMDKFAAHPVIDGRSFADIRCSQGIEVEELGLDGTCPLCDGTSECWDLYNKQYADIAKSRGIAIDSPEAQEGLKNERIELVKKMTIKQADVWYVFPIVVIDCEEKDGVLTTTPKLNEQGQITGTPMWYQIRERTYMEKWMAGFDSLDTSELGEEPTSPAGLWAVLNFTYTPRSGNHDKMGSAKALKVTFKNMGDSYNAWKTYFDDLTKDWTPEKAQETCVLDAVRDMAEMKEVADTLLQPVRDKLSMYELASGGATPTAPAVGTTSADSALANFGATPVAPQDGNVTAPVGELPNTGAPATPITAEVPNAGVAVD